MKNGNGPWFGAVVQGDLALIEQYAAQYQGAVDEVGRTALMVSLRGANRGVVEFLCGLEAGQQSPLGLTALMVACYADDAAAAAALVRSEARLRSARGITATMVAAAANSVRAMAQTAPLESCMQDADGVCALFYALAQGHREAARRLLEQEWQLADDQGRGAGYYAAISADYELYQLVLQHAAAHGRCAEPSLEQLLKFHDENHTAMSNKRMQGLRRIIDSLAPTPDTLATVLASEYLSQNGHVARYYLVLPNYKQASWRGQTMFCLMIKNGLLREAIEYSDQQDAFDADGRTPLHYLAGMASLNTVDSDAFALLFGRLFAAQNAVADSTGDFAIHIACRGMNTSFIELWLRRMQGTNVDFTLFRGRGGVSPLAALVTNRAYSTGMHTVFNKLFPHYQRHLDDNSETILNVLGFHGHVEILEGITQEYYRTISSLSKVPPSVSAATGDNFRAFLHCALLEGASPHPVHSAVFVDAYKTIKGVMDCARGRFGSYQGYQLCCTMMALRHKGYNLIEWAVRCRAWRICKVLSFWDFGPTPSGSLTPLMVAVRYIDCDTQCISLLARRYGCYQLTEAVSGFQRGTTALMMYLVTDHVKSETLSVLAACERECRTADGMRAYDLAVYLGKDATILELLK